jgi:hypothetical protein
MVGMYCSIPSIAAQLADGPIPIRHSPFNVANYVQVPYFTKAQTLQLFNKFGGIDIDSPSWRVNIDTSVVHDIWMNSNGCVLSFIATASFLRLIVSFSGIQAWWAYAGAQIWLFEGGNVSYQAWQDYSIGRRITKTSYIFSATVFLASLVRFRVLINIDWPTSWYLKAFAEARFIYRLIRSVVIRTTFPGAPLRRNEMDGSQLQQLLQNA